MKPTTPAATRRRTITENQRHQLLGLELLLQRNRREYDQLRDAAAEVVGEQADQHGFYGYADDFASGEHGVDKLLSLLEITVEPAP